MRTCHLYIAHFLLAGFLFPQVANAVHYLVQSHSLSHESGEVYDISVPPYDYHNCDYQFNSLKYYITSINGFQPFILAAREKEKKYFFTIRFINELAFHYTLRGPPIATNHNEEQNLFI